VNDHGGVQEPGSAAPLRAPDATQPSAAGRKPIASADCLLSREQCLDLVATAPYGRIVYTAGALPAVAPVRFTLEREVLRFDVPADTALADASRAGILAFHADFVDMSNGLGWTVTAVGRTRHLANSSTPDVLTAELAPELVAGHRTHIQLPARRVVDDQRTETG
jgi:uncharacterized protein